jgi:chemotaxis protein MotB
MTTNAKPVRPIFVIKKKVSHGGHHGGAWKVAYADFVTAMMSLFIVLWLMNSTPQIKKAVAGYFNDPKSSGQQTGTLALGSGETISIDKQNVEKLKEEIEKAILKQADLTKLSKQIDITITSEGLKIELIEQKGGTFFESGSPKLSENGVALMNLLSDQLKVLPNRLLIEGHTDAQPYSNDTGYTNWELSSDRANSARRLLQQDGIGPNQISQVRGYADQMLRVPSNPLDPSNRRISLIVQWVDAAAPAATAGAAPASNGPPIATAEKSPPSGSETPPSAPPVSSTEPPKTAEQPATPSPAPTSITPPKQTPAMKASALSARWTAQVKSLLTGKKKK